MRCKTLILYYNFFVNAACYYGLSMNIGDLGGDIFLNFSISGLSIWVIIFASFLCPVHFITVLRIRIRRIRIILRILIRNIFHGYGYGSRSEHTVANFPPPSFLLPHTLSSLLSLNSPLSHFLPHPSPLLPHPSSLTPNLSSFTPPPPANQMISGLSYPHEGISCSLR